MNSNDSDIEFYYSDISRIFGDMFAGYSETQTGTYDWRFTLSDRVLKGEELEFFITVVDDSGQPNQIINTTITNSGVAEYNLTEIIFVEDRKLPSPPLC